MNTSVIQDKLATLLTHLGLPFEKIVIGEEEGSMIRVDIVSPQPSRIIGWHGETLQALEHLLKSLVRAAENMTTPPFILLDTDGYRRMQEDKVCKIAEQKADFVRRTGTRVALAPMSPYFRRIVHLHVANTPSLSDLTTESVGEGEYRQIVLRMKTEKASDSGELSPTMAEDDLGNLDI
ncbi:MAG: R3H domain-containing nucleic acid-binding protein [Candidatus Peregrinibacteria bacterium]|nr:R3H domain-containing nucleic acid-binding protein [Candidatus Peregrinibacteria bacterium]